MTYSLKQVTDAVSVLELNGDVSTEITQYKNQPKNKTVVLTEQGFVSFSTKAYLKKAQDEVNAKELRGSTVWTNKFAIGSGIAAAIFALVTVIISSLQYCNQQKTISIEEIKELKDQPLKVELQPVSIDTQLLKRSSNNPMTKTVEEKIYDPTNR